MFFKKARLIKAQEARIKVLEKELDRLHKIESNNKTLRNKISILKKQLQEKENERHS